MRTLTGRPLRLVVVAFIIGFGVMFLAMIGFTAAYASTLMWKFQDGQQRPAAMSPSMR